MPRTRLYGQLFVPVPHRKNSGNLPDDLPTGELRSMFEKYGRVVECDIIKHFAFGNDNKKMLLISVNFSQ